MSSIGRLEGRPLLELTHEHLCARQRPVEAHLQLADDVESRPRRSSSWIRPPAKLGALLARARAGCSRTSARCARAPSCVRLHRSRARAGPRSAQRDLGFTGALAATPRRTATARSPPGRGRRAGRTAPGAEEPFQKPNTGSASATAQREHRVGEHHARARGGVQRRQALTAAARATGSRPARPCGRDASHQARQRGDDRQREQRTS